MPKFKVGDRVISKPYVDKYKRWIWIVTCVNDTDYTLGDAINDQNGARSWNFKKFDMDFELDKEYIFNESMKSVINEV